jgi:hypothetical protein
MASLKSGNSVSNDAGIPGSDERKRFAAKDPRLLEHYRARSEKLENFDVLQHVGS